MAVDHVLTLASSLVCTHTRPAGTPPPDIPVEPTIGGGKVTIPGVRALTVHGDAVLPSRPEAVTITGSCSQPITTSPPGNPCIPAGSTSALARITAGAATKLLVNGVPVLLATKFAATTAGMQPPAFDVDPEQNKLRAE